MRWTTSFASWAALRTASRCTSLKYAGTVITAASTFVFRCSSAVLRTSSSTRAAMKSMLTTRSSMRAPKR